MEVFAHRGASASCPENTMPAFAEALQAGADGIELDVQLTADGHIAVIHDPTVDRTTDGTGKVSDKNLAELKALQAVYKFGGQFGRVKIPLLQEVLGWLKGNSLLCNIELKTPGAGLGAELADKTIHLVKEAGLEERVILSSFNHYVLVYAWRIAPQLETAPIYRDGLYMPWIYAKAIGAGAMHPAVGAAPEPVIVGAVQAGMKVRPYLINSPEEVQRLSRIGTTGIITDDPRMAREVLGNRF